MNRTARGNRIGLAIVGAVLLLAGAAALVRGLDLMPDVLGAAGAPVTEPRLREFAADAPWAWWLLAVVVILIALLALRWLAVQTRSDSVRQLRLESDVRHGSTRMPANAATDALEDDLAASPYLRRAQAGLTGSSLRPRLRLNTTMEPTAEPAAVLDRINQALDRYGQALEMAETPATVQLRVGR